MDFGNEESPVVTRSSVELTARTILTEHLRGRKIEVRTAEFWVAGRQHAHAEINPGDSYALTKAP